MIIKNIEIKEYQKTFLSKTYFGQELFDIRKGWYLKIKTEEKFGIGEAAPIPFMSKESHADAGYALDGFKIALQDIDYDVSIEELLLLSDVHGFNNPSAKFAIQSAVYDLESQFQNKTVSQFLNSQSSNKININTLVHENSIITNDNTKVLKIKIHSNSIYEIKDSIDQLLDTYSNDIKLRIDFNGCLDLVKGIRICKELESYNIDYIEQPLAIDNLDDLYELRMHSNIPIAADEGLFDYNFVEKLIQESAADVFIVKPTLIGGYDDLNKIADLCTENDIRLVLTSSFETRIAQLFIIHMIASLNIREYCGVFNVKLFEDEPDFPILNSQYIISEKPGLNI